MLYHATSLVARACPSRSSLLLVRLVILFGIPACGIHRAIVIVAAAPMATAAPTIKTTTTATASVVGPLVVAAPWHPVFDVVPDLSVKFHLLGSREGTGRVRDIHLIEKDLAIPGILQASSASASAAASPSAATMATYGIHLRCTACLVELVFVFLGENFSHLF